MMMGSGMPNSHSRIPLPMLIHSRTYRDSTEAQRFDWGGGSGISVELDWRKAEQLGPLVFRSRTKARSAPLARGYLGEDDRQSRRDRTPVGLADLSAFPAPAIA
jgi:hypothetical protein